MRRILLRATNVLWVGSNGYQQDCRVSLNNFNGMQINLSLSFTGGGTCVVHLQSIDGFRFLGNNIVAQQSFIVIATHYRHDDEFLFFGKWQHGTSSGEWVVHANAEIPKVNIKVRRPQLLAAA